MRRVRGKNRSSANHVRALDGNRVPDVGEAVNNGHPTLVATCSVRHVVAEATASAPIAAMDELSVRSARDEVDTNAG